MLKQFSLVFFVVFGCYMGVNSHPQPLKHLTNELEVHVPARNSSYTEKFIVIDDQKRMKVTQGVEGDCLAIGCSVQIIQFDLTKKSNNSSVIKSDIAYAVKKGFEDKNPKPNIQLVAALAQLVKNFLENKNHA
ncbi:hypothetical protein V6N12_064576 [Hibiscus sabdariffa]|uniref:Uncharacterized protein n=1 Tax=Hibiscus sabdariffa TaxID=183260 RepID=A0ABR2G6E1_9ROSI